MLEVVDVSVSSKTFKGRQHYNHIQYRLVYVNVIVLGYNTFRFLECDKPKWGTHNLKSTYEEIRKQKL